jgi:enoyl-CoA hydratase
MIHLEQSASIAVLRLDHGKVSALDAELLAALDEALAAVERSAARALVLTGTGSSFSAGVDLFRLIDGGPEYVRRFLPLLDAALRRLFLFPRPVVAALNGHAIAGGCILACAGDRRILSEGKARLGVPELRVGVPFPVLALEIMRFAADPRKLQDLIYDGATFNAQEALQRGLVDEVVPGPELMDRAVSAAESLAAIPPGAFALVKRQLREPAMQRVERLARELDAQILAAWCAPEAAQAIRTYLDATIGKRP